MIGHLSAHFGSRLKQLRRDRSMTAVALARRVNVTPPAISHWEHNERKCQRAADFRPLRMPLVLVSTFSKAT